MRVHYLQHVSFEGIGAIGEWTRNRAHDLSSTEMFHLPTPALPRIDELDFLVVMGGPMNIYQEAEYPWLSGEKAFIASAIAAGRLVLGVCLGAQLVADVLGGPVSKGEHSEIGWYPLELTEAGRAIPVFARFPDRFTALHWHGDAFAIPPGAVHVASSEACANQAFAYDGGRVIGLQFHLEETPESLALLIANAGEDLAAADDRVTPDEVVRGDPVARAGSHAGPIRDAPGRWISTTAALLAPSAPYAPCRDLLFGLLDSMVVAH
jgi:GMP synthase-like glutamine amidotransferase